MIRTDVAKKGVTQIKFQFIFWTWVIALAARVTIFSSRSIRQVAGWLGHTDPAFTLRTYVHLMDDGLGDPLGGAEWTTD